MSSNSVRPRGGSKEKAPATTPPQNRDAKPNGSVEGALDKMPQVVKSEWDYKLAGVIITALAFVTRFWGIGHPNEVVFDEVHFGKVNHPFFGHHRRTAGDTSHEKMLIATNSTVRFILSPTDILLRCPSPIRKTAVCPHGLVRRLRWAFPL